MDLTAPRALVTFHEGTTPEAGLADLAWQPTFLPITGTPDSANFDFVALLVDARTGISASMIDAWQSFQERQIPRAMLVQGLEFSASDFDDIVLIGNRVLEPLATPFLVLHDELGAPIGLIELANQMVHDYSTSNPVTLAADPELRDLVTEFKREYEEEFLSLGEDAFAAGIYAIALPIVTSRKIGLAELNHLLATLPKP